MKSAIHYCVQAPHPERHHFEVRLTIDDARDGLVLYLPVWTPGSYLVREFARQVQGIQATAHGQPVALSKLDKLRWQLAPCEGPVTIDYQVYAFDLSVRGAYLDRQRGFFNGNALFLAIAGREAAPVSLEVCRPAGCDGWQLATGLPRLSGEPWGFGVFAAEDYAALIDHPVEMGEFTVASFMVDRIPHHLVIAGRHNADLAAITTDLAAVCRQQIALFGEAPFREYWFLVHAVGDGYGGLEHRNSTALLCRREDLRQPQDSERRADYLTFLGLASHEYFHAWNVKAVRPQAFMPYDLTQENYTRLLWAFEGITSYYDDLMLVRAGLMSESQYLVRLAETLTQVRRGLGRLKQTLEEASWDAWIKYYRPDENAANALLSYYTQGALAALVLDLEIRRRSEGAHSLDTVMRALYRECRETGVSETGWEALACRVTGLDLAPLFDQLLRTHDALPVEAALAFVGVDLQWRPAASAEDKGGWKDDVPARCELGARLEADPLGVKLAQVLEGSSAEQAGLAAGDILVALDGLRVTRVTLDSQLARFTPGQRVRAHAFRRDELLEVSLPLAQAAKTTAGLRVSLAACPTRQAWLSIHPSSEG